jgi:hypothetical protein
LPRASPLPAPASRSCFTSGYPAETVIRQGIAEASVAYVQKPYFADDLARKIRETLGG